MLKRILGVVCGVVFAAVLAVDVPAQRSRKSVGSSEVNGTFRYSFTGKFRKSYNEIKILALGKGKIKLAFDLLYPYFDGNGDMTANMGELEGIADISGDTAVYSSDEYGRCEITIKFVKPGTIKISQAGDGSGCGFGHNVRANGVFKKISSSKPKF